VRTHLQLLLLPPLAWVRPLLLPALAGWPAGLLLPTPKHPHLAHPTLQPRTNTTTPALPYLPLPYLPLRLRLTTCPCPAPPADPAKRIGIKEIQDHPWYMKDLPPGVKEMNDNMRMPPAGSQVRACMSAAGLRWAGAAVLGVCGCRCDVLRCWWGARHQQLGPPPCPPASPCCSLPSPACLTFLTLRCSRNRRFGQWWLRHRRAAPQTRLAGR
jgi:hypothetical protein